MTHASNCQSQSEACEDLLSAINVDLKSVRSEIRNHRDLWNQTEFLKPRDFVSDLARMEEINTYKQQMIHMARCSEILRMIPQALIPQALL